MSDRIYSPRCPFYPFYLAGAHYCNGGAAGGCGRSDGHAHPEAEHQGPGLPAPGKDQGRGHQVLLSQQLGTFCCRTSRGKLTALSCLTWRLSTQRRRGTGWTMPWTSTTRSARALLKPRYLRPKCEHSNLWFPRPRQKRSASAGTSLIRMCRSWRRRSPLAGGVRWISQTWNACHWKSRRTWKIPIQVTMEHLEESIRTLKEMFIERKPVIEVWEKFQ